MQMTPPSVEREIRLAGVPHYLVDDAAEVLGVHRRTVIRYMDDGKLTRVFYESRSVCIPVSEVHELLEELMAKDDGDRPGGAPPPGPKPSDGPPRGGA